MIEMQRDGRMSAPAPETRALLRNRLRRAEVLPTAPGWAVIRTITSTDDPDPPNERTVVAAGIIGPLGVALVDFIGFVAGGYETGVLTASDEEVERSVYFLNGDVVWASTTADEERLGEFLTRRGIITPSQLQTVLHTGRNCRIGEALVRQGFLAAHDLWAMLRAQLQEIFGSLVSAEKGMWSFARVSSETLAASQMHLPTQGLLVDALRRMDELKVYRQRVRSSQVVMQRLGNAPLSPTDRARFQKEHLGELVDQVLSELHRPASVSDLMRRLRSSEFELTRVVYHLLRANLIEQVEHTVNLPNRDGFDLELARDLAENYNMALSEVFDEVERAGLSGELHQRAQQFLDSEAATSSRAKLLRYVQIDPSGQLNIEALLTEAERLAARPKALRDSLSEVLFFTLFQAMELLGRRRGDDLARRVKMINNMLGTRQELG